ncbi:MAG: indolepyruvate oxidoreductase subunit beta family protein [Rhizobiales bacterium]|nr:indolepyruvate oxidoreductase subunit beta family protein [Hyphomicrobiales bacterium]
MALSSDRPISLAILAMGGQGGGVLAGWIVAAAERAGWFAQSTSVPGVAQRTGATLYYVEMIAAAEGHAPVLSLMPSPGDVDLVLATEYMEAGRAILRGLVTPTRTTLIASTHRAFAIAETSVPGRGIADSGAVTAAIGVAAKRMIAFDMERVATARGSVISASMLGALAASRTLPFPREAFERAISADGRGTEASLRAFDAAYEIASGAPTEVERPPARANDLQGSAGHPVLAALVQRVRDGFPLSLQEIILAGLRKLVGFQDPAYGAEYLDRLAALHRLDDAHDGVPRSFAFTGTSAKYLANAMAYDDVIRVADLKTLGTRFVRVKADVTEGDDKLVTMTEFMHPRMAELVGLLPAKLGLWLERRPGLFGFLDRRISKGRRIRTDALRGFLTLYSIAALRPRRRRSLRHSREMRHIEAWLATATALLPRHYDLAVEVIACRRLIKGYSDTHARGFSKFDRVLGALPRLESRNDAALWLRRLRQAALQDEEGTALDGALRTIAGLD